MQQDIIQEGPANLLMKMSNANLDTLTRRAQTYVQPVVAATGNWVGGRLRLTPSGIHFEMNRMNKRYQNNTDPVDIPLTEITAIARGRMLLFFPTADITTTTGLFRFRLLPGKTIPFLTTLAEMLEE